MAGMTTQQVLDELATLADPKIHSVNQRHGDDHAVNLTKLRALAKQAKGDPDLPQALWGTGDSAARLVALLISRPTAYSAGQIDAMLRRAGTPKVRAWLVSYVVKKSPHREELRLAWFDDADPHVAGAAWALTSERVRKQPEGLDLVGLLDIIESQMAPAPEPLQWAMNETLAHIGIENPSLRERAVAIGERLEVLKDYPTPPNCTSPYAPTWIAEMVRRAQG